MAKYSLITILCGLLCWIAIPQRAHAQSSRLLTFKITSPDTVRAGDTVKFVLTVNVAAPWHVYAPGEKNSAHGMQAIHLKFPKATKGFVPVGKLKYSKPMLKGPSLVYMGDGHTLSQQFAIAADATAGPIVIRGEVIYQACNDETCFPSMSESFSKTIYVISNPATTSERFGNKRSFQ